MSRFAFLSFVLLVAACDKKPDAVAETKTTAEPAKSSAPSATAKAPEPAPELNLAKVGEPAPDFEAEAHNGETIKLAELRGKTVVLYFYPKDDTPGCTIEAKGIRDSWEGFKKADTVVLGVSTDDNASHKAFAEKYELPFLLLPDEDEKIAKAYGVPIKSGYAKRVTFIIDKTGKVGRVFPKVNPTGHAEEVMAAIGSLG